VPDLQIEYWNGPGGQRWVESRDRLEQNMAHITQALFALVAPQLGERVLDVGCGCGRTTAALQERTGAPALGLDVSLPMVTVAQQQARPGLAFVHGDAATYALTPTYDLLFSRFGVMFFADPIAAFTHLRTALAPNGRVVFVCWRALALNVWASLPLAAARELLPPQPPVDPQAPGPFAFADRERLKGILASAGFREVTVEPHDTVMRMGDTLEDAARDATILGPLARLTTDLPAATLADIRTRIAAAYAPFVMPGGVEPTAAVWLVTAR
jgi:SAM-dependent methyltransferase